jgi:hypothetical protein
MKTVLSILLTVAFCMGSYRLGLAQPTPPAPAAAPAPAASPTPPTGMELSADQWKKRVERETERAMRQAAAANDAAMAAVKMRGGNFPINVNLNLGHLNQVSAKIQEAAARISEAPDDAAREAATANLLDVLDELFEADMRAREQDIAEIEARVARLQAQLEHRRAKKQEIIDLQAKVAINEAEGLGFYGERKPDGFDFKGPSFMTTPSSTILVPHAGPISVGPSSGETPKPPSPPSTAIPQ